MKKKTFQLLPLFFLAAAIALSPSFSAGTLSNGKIIEIRIEDFLLVILGLVWLANFLISGRKKIEKPPLFLPISAWLGVGFFSVLTNWIFGSLSIPRGFFYFLKEVEFFFVYFYVFYHVRSLDYAKIFIKLWILLGSINIGWVIYQIIRGSRFVTDFGLRSGTYGMSAIGEWGPFPTGAFFLLIFIFLFNILLYYFLKSKISVFKKLILIVSTLSLIIGVVGSGSKTGFLGLILAVFLSLFFLFLKRKNLKTVLTSVFILLFVFCFLFFSFLNYSKATKRISDIFDPAVLISNFEVGRVEAVIRPMFEKAIQGPLYLPIFGFGKGYVDEAHNYYLRNFIETGIIGSMIFFVLIFVIVKMAWRGVLGEKDQFSVGLSAGLLVATAIMLFLSFAAEAFISVKLCEVYWFFTAMTMAILRLNKTAKEFDDSSIRLYYK